MREQLLDKLTILADAAKYDASCASGGAGGRSAQKGDGGLGSLTGGSGICHSFTPDGRCVSLLKILMTNYCIYDCQYCINRISSNVQRARFSVEEVVNLTLDFYKRNYIEGLFLSSGIIRSPDYTMECMVRIAKSLRKDHGFLGYIHLKTIPNASPHLQEEAGWYADRLSINVEMPTEASLAQYAPEKKLDAITNAMGHLDNRIKESRYEKRMPRFAPGGQSTQMIVGADTTNDKTILSTSVGLYKNFGLRRVYYSAFSPIPDASSKLPAQPAPLLREHRLYQADWLLRFYEFGLDEIVSTTAADGMLDLENEPKLAWALANRDHFPVDVNTADRQILLRVPGFGVRTVDKILGIRRYHAIRLDDLMKLRVSFNKVRPFIKTIDYYPSRDLRLDLNTVVKDTSQKQLLLFEPPAVGLVS